MMRRTILSALAVVLAFAFAAEARAAGNYQLAETTWTTLTRGENGAIRVERIEFDQSGGFSVTATEGGKVVGRHRGTFEIEGDTLVLKVTGGQVRITIVSQDDKLMVIRIKGSETRYARIN